MEIYSYTTGIGLWKLQPVLLNNNWDLWFKGLCTIVEGEDVSFLLDKKLDQYSTIKDSERNNEPGNDWVSFYNPPNEKKPSTMWWHIESKRKEYIKAAANFKMNLQFKLNQVDKDTVVDIQEIPDKIKALNNKYYLVTLTASSQHIQAFTQWEMDESKSPQDNWIQLHKLRKEAHRYSNDMQFSTTFTWHIFVVGLRPRRAYETICESFTDKHKEMEKLQRLNEKWMDIHLAEKPRKDRAFAAAAAETKPAAPTPVSDFEAFLRDK